MTMPSGERIFSLMLSFPCKQWQALGQHELGSPFNQTLVRPRKSAEATCTRFSRDSDDLLAIGTSAGIVEIYNAQSGRFSYKLDVGRKGMRKWSITSLSFRSSKFAKVAQNMLVSCGTSFLLCFY